MDELYSDHILEHAIRPKNRGECSHCSAGTLRNAGCTDELTFFLDIQNGVIQNAMFTGTLCALSTASASLFSEYIKNKSVDEVRAMLPHNVYSLLCVTITPMRSRCALLPLETVQHIVNSYA